MKNKNKNKIACLFLALSCEPALCYEQLTHQDLSEKAIEASRLEASGKLAELGLAPDQRFPGSDVSPLSIVGLIRHGADLEDEGARPKNHFFDPYYNRGASLPPGSTAGSSVGERSPDWIVDGVEQPPPEFSLRRARALFIEGLAATKVESRNAAWGLMFQNLGHVVHHLQDMAQPQHVRNDIHLIHESVAALFDGEFKLPWEDRSWFEQYSLANPAIWQAYVPAAATPVTFDRAREFWATSDGRGIAQFTNRNFVSSDTNFISGPDGAMEPADDYPFPRPAGRNTRPLRDPALGIGNADDLCTRLAAHPVAHGQPCLIDFIETLVIDGYAGGEPALNDRAASFSVFDAQLSDVDHTYFGQRLFTLNSLNFRAAYRFLIPKAINYSAGMINHFFRGRLRFENAEAQDGWITVEFTNVSAPGSDFSDGKFWIYYDSTTGTRKPLMSEAADLAVGARHQFRFAVPFDIDLRAENPFAITFEGRIGGDAGVSGLVFDVADVIDGFVFRAGVQDGPLPPQLLYRAQDQWRLHPQGQWPAGGQVDWKGWYVDGKPTRVLTWDGWRYAKLHAVNAFRSPNIYQGGKTLAVAPWNVLGAALQKDADGNTWVVAICDDATLDQDVVIRRPARKSKSAALHDPATAPDGWRVIGRYPRAEHHSSMRDTWQFNGAGTEAQTMRALISNSEDYRPYTRLKVSVAGESAVFQDLGNTRIVHTVATDTIARKTADGRTYDYCSGSGTVNVTGTTSTTGSAVVAVDYVDGREVLARISAEGSGVGTERGSAGSGSLQIDIDSTETTRWTLEIGTARHEVMKDEQSYRVRYRRAEPYHLEATRQTTVRAAIVALDLRSGIVALQRRHYERSTESVNPSSLDGPVTESTSTHRQYAFEGPANASSPPVDASSTAGSGNPSDLSGTATVTCSRSVVPSGGDTREDQFDLNVVVGQGAYNRYVDDVGSATDRAGNVFLSLRHTDTVTKQTHFLNYLTGADPVALLGPRQFEAIRPR